MKTSFKFFAALVVSALVSTAAFATDKKTSDDNADSKNQVAINSLAYNRGVRVTVIKDELGKASVNILDKDRNMLYHDALPKKLNALDRGYVVTDLDAGDYFVQVQANGETVTKKIHVYQEDENTKSFFFYQDQE